MRFMRERAIKKPAIEQNNNNDNQQIPTYQSDNVSSSQSIVERANIADKGSNGSNGAKLFNKQIKYTANQIAICALREQGLSQSTVAKEIGVTKGYVSLIDRKVSHKWDLTDTKLVRGAHKTIKNLSRGLPIGTIDKVKDSTALAAASMIYDRYQPVVHHSTNITANISPVDMTKYMINIDNSMSAQLIENQSGREQEGPGAADSPPHDVSIPIEGGEGKKENT